MVSKEERVVSKYVKSVHFVELYLKTEMCERTAAVWKCQDNAMKMTRLLLVFLSLQPMLSVGTPLDICSFSIT